MSFKTSIPVLSVDKTKLFLKQIDLACRLLDVKILKEVIERFELQNLEDIPEFLQDAPEKFEFRKEGKSVQIKEVLTFSSKCIACVYGKTVMGYIIRFSVEGPGSSRINYERYFAMNYLIVEDRLTDFGWCHSFLHPKELEELEN